MNERLSLEIYDMKIKKCEQQGFRCGVCGKTITPYTCQLAHRIPNTKFYKKQLGKRILHNELNLVAVCSLKCNDAVLLNPQTRPVETYDLIKKIKEQL